MFRNVPKGIEFNLHGYKPFHFTIRDPSGINGNAGGGVGIWIDSNLEYEPIKDLSMFEKNVFESQFIKLKTDKNKFTILGNIYRPPAANIVRFNEILDEILTSISNDPQLKKAEEIQLVSDTNIDLLKYRSHNHTAAYVDTLISHGLLPLITLPTRITPSTATVIDHISTSNKADHFDSGIIISTLSDHLPVFYIKKTKLSKQPPKNISSRKINSKTIPIFDNLLQNTNWDNVVNENNPQDAFNNFFGKISVCVDQAFPLSVQNTKSKFLPIKPWMSSALLVSRKNHTGAQVRSGDYLTSDNRHIIDDDLMN